MENLDKTLQDIINSIYEKESSQDIWSNSKFELQRKIQIDKRGSVGERFFASVLTEIYHPRRIEYKDGDQGDWDLKINGKKFEIKTSSLDTNNKFQNEGLKKDGDYDAILFLGIAPNNIYVRIVKKNDIDFDNLKLSLDSEDDCIHLHNRGKYNKKDRVTGAGYKCDFKKEKMIEVKTLTDIKIEFDKKLKGWL